MAPTLDATPKGPNSNSYLTVTEATDYFDAISQSKFDAWSTLDGNEERYLIRATKIVDSHFDFMGARTTNEQSLQWPRDFVPRDGIYADEYWHGVDYASDPYYSLYSPYGFPRHSEVYRYLIVNDILEGDIQFLDKDNVPEQVKEGTAEIALKLKNAATNNEDPFGAIDSRVKSEKVDVIQIEYLEPGKYLDLAQGIIPPEALPKLERYGYYIINPATPGYKGSAGIA